MNIQLIYQRVSPIVRKLQRQTYIKLWDASDWEQEGMIILYQLVRTHDELLHDDKRLRAYFKTKFSNYINDHIRHQESQKRRFNKMVYEDITEIGHLIGEKGWDTCDYLTFREQLEKARRQLTKEQQDQLDMVISGQRFKGKKAFLKQLAQDFVLFKDMV